MRAFGAQLRTELVLGMRQGEQLLVSVGIPLGILVFFSQVDVLPTGDLTALEFLTPAVLALSIMSTSMVSLGIGTGFERHSGVLKRLGATPLGRPRLIGAKIASVLVTEAIVAIVLVTAALAMGWDPPASGWAMALGAALAGTAAFAGLGLALAGRLSGPANLAVCNGLYLALLLTGGMVVPSDELPSGLAAVTELLPAAALSQVMVDSLTGRASDGSAWAVLAVWAVVLPAAAVTTFRWEP